MEISYDESSFLDVSMEVVVDNNNNLSTDEFEKEPPTSTPIVNEKKPRVHVHKCSTCTYSTTSRGNLHRHKQSVHMKKKSVCPSCAKAYSSPYDLHTHIRVAHNDTPFMCEVCSQRFNSRGSLRRHHLSIHSEGCNFICQTCGAKYIEKEAYIGHVNKHIGSKPYSCAQCGDKFGYKSCWRRHLQTCPSNPRRKEYKCDTCGVVLNSKAVLLVHVQGKHGSKVYKCTCGKSFSWRTSFARHKKTCKFV